jgi:hypothetical protein
MREFSDLPAVIVSVPPVLQGDQTCHLPTAQLISQQRFGVSRERNLPAAGSGKAPSAVELRRTSVQQVGVFEIPVVQS